jgi:glyoxylase I family protein
MTAGRVPPLPGPVPRVDHVTLTVSDLAASTEWYQRVLGPAELFPLSGPGWTRTVLIWPGRLMIGLSAYTHPAQPFDHTRIGLDHLGLHCGSEAEVHAWAARMDALGIVRGPVEAAPYGWAVTSRDPDAIPVEFFCVLA